MRFVKLLFFLSFLSPALLTAQTIFLKGYYVTLNKDTVKGYIEYRGTDRNFSICSFRTEPNALETELSPKEIAGYVVEDRAIFESHLVTTKKAVKQQVFLQIITTGKLSLLRYQNSYYARNQSGEIFDISKRRVVKDNKSEDQNMGVGMLKTLVADCPEMTGTYIEKEYTSGQHLIDIFQKYNACVGSSYEERPVPANSPIPRFGLLASPMMNWLRLKGPFADANFDADPGVAAGGFVSILVPKMGERFRLVLEASYDQASHYAFFTAVSNVVTATNSNNDVFVNYSRIRVPLFLRYDIKPFFVEGGLQNQFLLTQEFTWRQEFLDQDQVITNYSNAMPFNVWSSGFLLGAGLKFRVMDRIARSSVRYSQSSDLFHAYDPVFRTVELILSLELKK